MLTSSTNAVNLIFEPETWFYSSSNCITTLFNWVICKQSNNGSQFRIENLQTQNWIKNKERKGVENQLELMKFESTNPQDSQCLFESLDQMSIYSSIDGGENKFRDEEGGSSWREKKKKRKLKKILFQNLLFVTRFWPLFFSAIYYPKCKINSIIFNYINPISLSWI